MSDLVRFGPFTFAPESGVLTKHGVVVRLQPQPARVLAILVARAGTLVSREELRQQIWADGTFVDFERGLNFAIAHIRGALGDSADTPVYIKTVPKRGYRFIAPVTEEAPTRVTTAVHVDSSVPEGARRGRMVAVTAVAIIAGATIAQFVIRSSGSEAVRIAVVPFDNETGQDTFDRVAVAIADQTVARLATGDRLRRVSVIGNSAALRWPRAFRDIKEIGQDVNAEYVVLAQMKTDESKVRLIAHLIRVSDEAHVWADSFDRASFTLDAQAEIAEAIARAVSERFGDSRR